jgi:hypothetical protein
VSETKDENLLAGSTAEAPDGMPSLPVMRDGEEPPDMLLAILNSALTSMINSQQAKIMGTALLRGRRVTLLAVYDVVPTGNNLLVEAQPTSEE